MPSSLLQGWASMGGEGRSAGLQVFCQNSCGHLDTHLPQMLCKVHIHGKLLLKNSSAVLPQGRPSMGGAGGPGVPHRVHGRAAGC
jgi:hypothetical protein